LKTTFYDSKRLLHNKAKTKRTHFPFFIPLMVKICLKRGGAESNVPSTAHIEHSFKKPRHSLEAKIRMQFLGSLSSL
jgi:hypothetical protein